MAARGARITTARCTPDMPRKSQRKGRGAELEVAALFRAAGFDACATGLYDRLDVRVGIDGHDRLLECKRRKQCLGDHEQWLLVIPLRTFFGLAAGENANEHTDNQLGREPQRADSFTKTDVDNPC
jgi:hypothetical protein